MFVPAGYQPWKAELNMSFKWFKTLQPIFGLGVSLIECRCPVCEAGRSKMLTMQQSVVTMNQSQVDPLIEDLYYSEGKRLIGVARLLLNDHARAEEIVQDVFERALRKRPRSFDTPAAYLRQSVVNACRDDLRRKQRGIRIGSRFSVVGEGTVESSEAISERNYAKQRLRAAVDSLPDQQRECVLLRYFMELSTAETATTLGIPEGTVKSHLHRAMERLETLIGDLR